MSPASIAMSSGHGKYRLRALRAHRPLVPLSNDVRFGAYLSVEDACWSKLLIEKFDALQHVHSLPHTFYTSVDQIPTQGTRSVSQQGTIFLSRGIK